MNTNQLAEILDTLIDCHGTFVGDNTSITWGIKAKVEQCIKYVKDELRKDFKPRKFQIVKECKRKGYIITEVEPGVFNIEKVNEKLSLENVMHDLYYKYIKEITNNIPDIPDKISNEWIDMIDIIEKEIVAWKQKQDEAYIETKNTAFHDGAMKALNWTIDLIKTTKI